MFIGLRKATISRFFLLYLCEFITFSNYFPLFGTINQINESAYILIFLSTFAGDEHHLPAMNIETTAFV